MRLWIYPIKNINSAKSGILLSSKNDKQKALQINFSARVVDLQGFNKFLQFGYNHLIRFTLYTSILNYIPARLTLADFAMFFAIEIITRRTKTDLHQVSSSIWKSKEDLHSLWIIFYTYC